ncbi:MAG: pyridoxamine 5'-phosphate oxidase family protein [Ferruginibacter sp.]
MENASAQLQKFKDLINEIKTCILITKSAVGKLKGRPMATAKVDDDGSIWFFTNEYSGKVEEISHQNEILLSYSSPSKNSYVVLSAKAVLSDDRQKIKELWNPLMKAWFPQGLDDPNILLVKAEPEEIEYWDSSANKIVILFDMLKSAVTGKEYSEGEHGKLSV